MKRKKYVPWCADGYAWPSCTVFAVDPSMASTGWSVVRFEQEARPRLLGYGTVRSAATGDASMESVILRSTEIVNGVLGAYGAWGKPEHVAIELPVPTTLKGRQGANSQSGSIMAACIYNGIVHEHPSHVPTLHHPTHVKRMVADNGRAEKSEVKLAVMQWLGVAHGKFNQDVSDSIAVALTYGIERIDDE